MKHTPGPWKVKSDYNVFSGGGRLVANSGGHSGSVCPEEIHEENKANAILIAAAPDLLEALENLERVAGIAMTEDDPDRVAARIAIAKARHK